MAKLVEPRVYWVGTTHPDEAEIARYLADTGQSDFLESWRAALAGGVHPGLALCSLYAKMCYKSLVLGKNTNVKRVRDIPANLESCFDTGHGSVFGHCNLNFIVTDCSRVLTHEQVRHRSAPPAGNPDALDNDLPGDGWEYSQTSGRYCRLDEIDLVWDPVLDPVRGLFLDHLERTEDTVYLAECRLGLRKPNPANPQPPDYWVSTGSDDVKWVPDDTFDFEKRKAITSAIRRIAPNGQANEIGMTCNVRSLRHVVQLRTSRFAEREIRLVYNQVYHLVKARCPLMFHGARERVHNDLIEVYGMRQQPYDHIPE